MLEGCKPQLSKPVMIQMRIYYEKTKITELLGIEYPVIQGGMAWVAEASLAVAVSDAGGLGLTAAAAALQSG